MKHYYKDIEIETSSETLDQLLVGVAKFTRPVDYIFTTRICGLFSTSEEAEKEVLAQARVLIDKATKSHVVPDHRAEPTPGYEALLRTLQSLWKSRKLNLIMALQLLGDV